MRIMKTNWMKKNLQFALMAAMMLPSALVLNACSDDDKPDSGEVDARIEKVVPNEYRKQMEKYITIYDGVNPPNVEGVFIAESPILVYDSSGTYEPGKVFYDYYYKFSNQNSSKNTVDYKRTNEEGNDTESSTGAFISGDGKNFTIFFNTTGSIMGISVKRALIVSGTMTDEGVRNMMWAFVMTEKGSDPDNTVMDVGDFRVVKDKDGLAENATWPLSTRTPEFIGNTELFSDISSGK